MTAFAEAKRSAELLSGLAETTRIRIMDLLLTQEGTVTEIATSLGVEIANVSHHLRTMHAAGLLDSEKRGRYVAYRLNPELVTTTAKSVILDLKWCRLTVPRTPHTEPKSSSRKS